ncbi:MAG: helix-turn-helix domain-containing protein [Chryseolinea sp.]
MKNWQIFLAVVCGMALVQSLFLAVLMFVKDRLNRGAQFYLGIMLLGLALRLAKSYFVFVPQAYPEPGVIAGGAGLWVIGPAFYCYARLCYGEKLDYRILIHFLPALLILVSGLTQYVYYVGLLQLAFYFGYSVHRMRRQSNIVPKHFRILAACVGLILSCFIVQASQGGIYVYTVGVTLAIGILYILNFFLASDGDILSSMIAKKSRQLDKKLSARITTELNRLLAEQKIYRNKGLKLSELAKQSSYPAYLISQSINQEYNIRFNEFLNRFRVREAMERLESSDTEKIETIAKDVGFSSVTSLYEAFKRETQVTPQVYRNKFAQRQPS